VPQIKSYVWTDAVRGELSAGEEALDDFILIKSDGYPTYNFAHIIDDLEMGVTHIMRSDEFISSTPKFLSLYDALGVTHPVFVTLPPILGKEGTKKLGKRDGAKDVLDYREEGYLPEAMVNFLALLGWNPGGDKEVMSLDELVSLFDIAKIHKSGAMFNEEKLLWMNKEHMKRQTLDIQLSTVKKYMSEYPEDILYKLLPSIIDRISVYGELVAVEKEEFHFFIKAPVVPLEKISWKDTENHITQSHLEKLCELLSTADYTSVDTLKLTIMPYAEKVGKGTVLWPLRMSLSGQEKSVDPFTICYVLGRDETLARITRVIDAFRAQPSINVSSG
jgi:glutamyl-tRNA synthetase